MIYFQIYQKLLLHQAYCKWSILLGLKHIKNIQITLKFTEGLFSLTNLIMKLKNYSVEPLHFCTYHSIFCETFCYNFFCIFLSIFFFHIKYKEFPISRTYHLLHRLLITLLLLLSLFNLAFSSFHSSSLLLFDFFIFLILVMVFLTNFMISLAIPIFLSLFLRIGAFFILF